MRWKLVRHGTEGSSVTRLVEEKLAGLSRFPIKCNVVYRAKSDEIIKQSENHQKKTSNIEQTFFAKNIIKLFVICEKLLVNEGDIKGMRSETIKHLESIPESKQGVIGVIIRRSIAIACISKAINKKIRIICMNCLIHLETSKQKGKTDIRLAPDLPI